MAKVTTNLFGTLALLPQQAEAPVKETLSFLTDVLTSYNGKEQRLQLRSKARQSFSYTTPLQAWHTAAAFNTEYGAIRERWAIPIWTEGQYVGTVAQNASSISCDTSNFDFRNNSLAMLYAACGEWRIIEIASVETGQINIGNNFAGIVGAWLLPVRVGRIAGSVDKPTNGHNGKTRVSFEVEDNLEFFASVPSQYLSNDIYYEPGLLNGASLGRSLEKREDINDFSLGPVEVRSPWLNSRFGTPYRQVLQGASEVRAFKEFIYRRAGKFRAFWMPSFEVNMRVKNVGNIASTLVIESDSYLDFAAVRTNIAIQTTAGVWLPRVVSNPVQINATSIQLTLSSPLNINAANVARVSYLGLYRLDTDRIELSWNGGGVAETEIRILELNP